MERWDSLQTIGEAKRSSKMSDKPPYLEPGWLQCRHMHTLSDAAYETRFSHGVVYFGMKLTSNRQFKPTSIGLRKSRPSLPQPQALGEGTKVKTTIIVH